MSAAPHRIAYTSIAAMLAHRRALEASRDLKTDERAALSAIRAILDSLDSADRAAVESDAVDPAAERHRQRALRALARAAKMRGAILD